VRVLSVSSQNKRAGVAMRVRLSYVLLQAKLIHLSMQLESREANVRLEEEALSQRCV
jgi:hypothetical protein